MELRHTQISRRLTPDEILEAYKIERNIAKEKPKPISRTARMKAAVDSHRELCFILADGKPSEIEAVKRLTTRDFNKLVELKHRQHEKNSQ